MDFLVPYLPVGSLPSHSSSTGLKLMAKSWETCPEEKKLVGHEMGHPCGNPTREPSLQPHVAMLAKLISELCHSLKLRMAGIQALHLHRPPHRDILSVSRQRIVLHFCSFALLRAVPLHLGNPPRINGRGGGEGRKRGVQQGQN